MRKPFEWIFLAAWFLLVAVTCAVLLDTAHLAWTMHQPRWVGSRHDACYVELSLLIVSPVAALVGVSLPALWQHNGLTIRCLIGASLLMMGTLTGFIYAFWP